MTIEIIGITVSLIRRLLQTVNKLMFEYRLIVNQGNVNAQNRRHKRWTTKAIKVKLIKSNL